MDERVHTDQMTARSCDLQSVVAYLHKPVPAGSTADAPSPPPAAGVEPGQVDTVNFHCMSDGVQGDRRCIYTPESTLQACCICQIVDGQRDPTR